MLSNPMGIDIDREIGEEKTKFDDAVAALERRRELAELVNRLARASDMDLEVGCAVGIGTIDCLYVSLYLTEDEPIQKIRPFLRTMAETRLFKPAEKRDYLELSWMGWGFTEKEPPRNTVLVRVWYGASMVCTKEPTGKTVEEMEVVCRKKGDSIGE